MARVKSIKYMLIAAILLVTWSGCSDFEAETPDYGEARSYHFFPLGEPFGVSEKDGVIFVSDGGTGRIYEIKGQDTGCDNGLVCGGKARLVTDKLKTPSHIVVDQDGSLIVADSGDHTIRRVTREGLVTLVAGVPGQPGFRDGAAKEALFRAPIGIEAAAGKIFVADSYNDRVRVIENGQVRTLAGSARGFSDAKRGDRALFDTPCGIKLNSDGGLLIADLGNRRLRLIGRDGSVATIAGNGFRGRVDGALSVASFEAPTDVEVASNGEIFVADGDAVRVIGARFVPVVETITGRRRGFLDGGSRRGRFNRVSGLAIGNEGEIYATDSDNGMLRVFGGRFGAMLDRKTLEAERKNSGFDRFHGGRWPYEPGNVAREVAGTFGELRGEVGNDSEPYYFHNGLDIPGAYKETARLVSDDKVLDPDAVQNIGTLRELVRLRWNAYIHVRIGLDEDDKKFEDDRFLFDPGSAESEGVRIARGTVFRTGEPVGTLNRMNHVHLVSGASGWEVNGLVEEMLPGLVDTKPPVLEKVGLYTERWRPLETENEGDRITVSGRVRVVAEGYDRMDGNLERRRLGIWGLGYRVFDSDGRLVGGDAEDSFNITFSRLPEPDLAGYIFSEGSRSGATGPTIFRYIVTNRFSDGKLAEGFINFEKLPPGAYTIEVAAKDIFGNETTWRIEVLAQSSVKSKETK